MHFAMQDLEASGNKDYQLHMDLRYFIITQSNTRTKLCQYGSQWRVAVPKIISYTQT